MMEVQTPSSCNGQSIVRVLLGREVVCSFEGETQVELGVAVVVGQDPEELEGVGAASSKGVGHHGRKGKSLSKIMEIILPPLGGFHTLEASAFELLLQVEGVADGDVHDEFGVSRGAESVVGRDDIAHQGHHVGTLTGWGLLTIVTKGDARFVAGSRDATFVGGSGELLGKLGMSLFARICCVN